jgi:hypothetical protein
MVLFSHAWPALLAAAPSSSFSRASSRITSSKKCGKKQKKRVINLAEASPGIKAPGIER